jgi:short-subunit dehydrogenase
MPRRKLAGAAVVITGASSGIGQATAEAFAREGARLVLASRNAEALENVANACRTLGGDAYVVRTDVTDAETVKRLAETARDRLGRIDVWVSNVGVGAVGRFHETPIAAHEQVIRANLIGHMNDAHAVLPIFLSQGHGTFINMISLGAFAPTPFAAAYSASKYGLKAFSEALRGELSREPHIHICDVYPAFIDTPGLRHGANYVGRAVTAPPPVYDPRDVAGAIVRIAERPRPSTIVGGAAHLIRLQHFLAPRLSTWITTRIIERYFRTAPRAPISEGNLFSPPANAGGIYGGLRSPDHDAKLAMARTVFAAAFALAVLAVLQRRRTARASLFWA